MRPLTFKGTELQQRVKTALLGASLLLLLLVFGGKFGAGILGAAISLGTLHEYLSMTLSLPDREEKRMVLLGTTWLIAFMNFLMPHEEFTLLIYSFIGLSGYFLWTARRYQEQLEQFNAHFKELMFSIFGLLYLGMLPLYVVSIRECINGHHWLIVFFLLVWSVDTGAYFAGKRWGKRKLYPLISPKKTMEGAIGGVVTALLVTLLYKGLFFRSMSWAAGIMAPILVGVLSQLGDLCESYLKRTYSQKESGTLLPGHGGFLDRFDGVLFGLPVMYGCIKLLS